ncbi:MAG: hypothetical protein AAF772_00330 [Acidobacteriota bacterium]
MAVLRKATKLSQATAWHHFISSTGEQGKAWYQRYLDAGSSAINQQLDVGVLKIRRGEQAEGRQMLAACAAAIDALESTDSSIALVLRLNWLSGEAFSLYHHREVEKAVDALDECEALVARILELSPFLVPLAGRCCDFCLHRVRLFRGERQWPAMWRTLDRANRMVGDEIPLCHMAAGRDLYMRDVYAFYRAIEPEDALEREALELLSQPEKRQRTFASRALSATSVPNVVVVYP